MPMPISAEIAVVTSSMPSTLPLIAPSERALLELGDRGQNRDQHQRRDHHLQQPDVAAADNAHPVQGARG